MTKLTDFRRVSSLLGAQITEVDDPPVDHARQNILNQRWQECAGRSASWSHPILFSSGRLVVFTQSSIWATELRHHQTGILNSLKDLDVTSIDIRTTPAIAPPSGRAQRKIKISEANLTGMEMSASGLKHDGLRQAVGRLVTKQKKVLNKDQNKS